jgi:hypothetical protein
VVDRRRAPQKRWPAIGADAHGCDAADPLGDPLHAHDATFSGSIWVTVFPSSCAYAVGTVFVIHAVSDRAVTAHKTAASMDP